MIVTRKTVGRRTVLRGLGAAVSLPLLDAMVPALTALAQTPAKSRARFGVVYVPMGAVMNNWTPAETGAGFALSPILEPIGKFRDRMVVLTNLDNEPAVAEARRARRRPRPHRRRVPDGRARQADRGRRLRGRRLDRPDRRPARRPADAAGFARARARDHWNRRRVRRRVQLRVRQHAVLAHGERCRSRWRTTRGRCSSACSATATAPSPRARQARMAQRRSILDSVTESVSRSAALARTRRRRAAQRVLSTRYATSSAASSEPKPTAPPSSRSSSGQPAAFRPRSRSTRR